jgi:probable rRNA maturation factor
MSIEILNESGTEVGIKQLSTLSRFVLDRMRVHPLAELCIKVVDEDTIATLNERWMEATGSTDVLAFPMDELRPGLVNEDPEEGVLGDLVLCPDVAERHAEPDEHQEMFGLQARLLSEWQAVSRGETLPDGESLDAEGQS